MNNKTNDSTKLLALNKPKGYLVTRSDDLGRKTVYDILPQWAYDEQWMPIGRLDLESRGLLLFSQDGQISNYLTKPGNCVKIYEIWVRGHVTDEHIAQALKGVQTPQGLLKALVVEKIGQGGAKTKLRIQIDEGKNRHIRRLFGALKDPKFGTPLKVVTLTRISIGTLGLDIDRGTHRFLSIEEEKSLLKKFSK
ncbi:pseudouridine synthase [Poseidonibacter lekithochrous]|uniref:pseudouridine synthase n=1 Tax=Poseidonibacter lekithochrous TaxID=1904463 RepID=UPI0008FCB979|nr:pseudouridine synthase [Poseidonibacter lekithochrous]QKJ23560.1 RsuA-like pseudouridine synthase [Poseidonibacter lekithochrous]